MNFVEVKNVSSRPLRIYGIVINPGETKIVPEGGDTGYCFLRGKIHIVNKKIKEKVV
jgi:hypothetical protein